MVLAFAAVYVIWGSTYLAIRIGIETIPPLLMPGIRFTAAGILLYAWARMRGAIRPTLIEWRSAGIIGVALLCICNGALSWAELRLPSGIAALLMATVPMWFVIMEWFAHGGKAPRHGVTAGLAVGFIGIILLVGPDRILGHDVVDLTGVAVLTVGCIAWANGSLYSRRARLPGSQLLATSMEMIAGGSALLLAGTLGGEWSGFDVTAVSIKSWLAVVYLVLFGSIIGFTAYVWLLRNTEASWVATYAFVNPVIAVFLGWAIAGEQLNSHVFFAGGFIVLAVVLIISSQSRLGTPGQPGADRDSRAPRGRLNREFAGK